MKEDFLNLLLVVDLPDFNLLFECIQFIFLITSLEFQALKLALKFKFFILSGVIKLKKFLDPDLTNFLCKNNPCFFNFDLDYKGLGL